MLEVKAVSEAAFEPVAKFILRDAKGYEHNSFKIELARRAIIRALIEAAGVEVAS